MSVMALFAQSKERYLHCPRLVAREPEGAKLLAIAWQADGEHVWAVDVGPDASLENERLEKHASQIVTLTRGDTAEITDDEDAELCETRAGHHVRVVFVEGHSEIHLRMSTGEERIIWRGPGAASSPTLAVAAHGVWIAFHHDVREDEERPDVAKWIALRFVSADGEIFMPQAEMKERDRDREGVEQSFEFPALVIGDDGAVALFGRGSHNFWRQDLSTQGFSERLALSDGEWGSRGRHIVAHKVRDGIVVARRDRKGLELNLLKHVHGGPPALVPAPVRTANRFEPGRAARVSRALDPAQKRGLFTLFGDIQQHSAHSDGLGSAHEVYVRARHRYGDDFVALTDHESFLGKRTAKGEWEYLQRVADRFDEPHAFSTLYAYEWTGKMYPGPGHKCVYYPRRGVPIVSRDDVPEGKELVARVRALGGFSSPHHIGWTGADEPGHDDEGQPLWEVCSCHGCYEHTDHPLGQRGALRDQMVDQMLKKGHRFGFTASSDSHGLLWHHGEARKRDPYRTGLTAVIAKENTREAIFAALVQRRCYATSGVKILLDVLADGQPMGSVIPGQRGATFEVEAVGTDALSHLELVNERGVIGRVDANSERATLRANAEGQFVYARVVQRDGEMAWSSPVFFGESRANPIG